MQTVQQRKQPKNYETKSSVSNQWVISSQPPPSPQSTPTLTRPSGTLATHQRSSSSLAARTQLKTQKQMNLMFCLFCYTHLLTVGVGILWLIPFSIIVQLGEAAVAAFGEVTALVFICEKMASSSHIVVGGFVDSFFSYRGRVAGGGMCCPLLYMLRFLSCQFFSIKHSHCCEHSHW